MATALFSLASCFLDDCPLQYIAFTIVSKLFLPLTVDIDLLLLLGQRMDQFDFQTLIKLLHLVSIL